MKVDLQPWLRGNSIELRPLRPEDFEALFQAASDPLIWEQHPEPNRYQWETFQKYFSGAIEIKRGLGHNSLCNRTNHRELAIF